MGQPTIRDATLDDAAVIADLLGQLGYPSTASEVIERIERLREFPAAMIHLAEIDGRPVGVITCHIFPSIHAPTPVAWLTTLIIDSGHARRGIGKALTESAEHWARAQGALRIAVTSGKHRDGAHAFYQQLGYELTGVRLNKPLMG